MTPSYAPAADAVRNGLEGAKAGAAALSQSVGAAARTSQTIGIEWMDFLKQVSAEVTATTEKVVKAGSPAKAIEIQSAFVKTSGELWMARAATFRDLYATLAQDMAKPFTTLAGRSATAAAARTPA
ncbi:phasin family protein [Methylobacterium sp. E-025]|uniref:phasin family protein n=1 Tax=Methylobacterium sp. E-025 TaxID=2836561 RepID=UPI001FB96201|nr:phasin family protein [Methylobacterium sp. E-025]MCJ2111473.1 phasin family protein [Methylobacterium sp. E-025]